MSVREITNKQKKFCELKQDREYTNVRAYREAFNNYTMSNHSVAMEAQRILKRPLVDTYLKDMAERIQKKVEQKLVYSAKESFDELEKLKKLAIKNKGKSGKADVGSAIKAEELRGKLANLYVDQWKDTTKPLGEDVDYL